MDRVGYFNRTRYWQIYAFSNPPEGYTYKRGIDIPFHLAGIDNPILRNVKIVLPFQNVDLFHSYNSIISGSKPWVVEVESQIPRFGNLKESHSLFQWGINRLQSEDCRAIIFTSESSKRLNEDNFARWNIDAKKCHVVYRAVETYEKLYRTEKDKVFTILFVGNGFYRKGGVELVKAFEGFKRKDVRLIIISNFEVDWEYYPTEQEKKYIKYHLANNNRIEVYQDLSHPEVINWMRKSDVFVSTTHADPFNNTILEAQACGVPTITSDVRATPEFVENEWNGFVYPMKSYSEETAIEFIRKYLNMYYDNSALLMRHSRNARRMVETRFLLEHRNRYLKEKIYDCI